MLDYFHTLISPKIHTIPFTSPVVKQASNKTVFHVAEKLHVVEACDLSFLLNYWFRRKEYVGSLKSNFKPQFLNIKY